MTEYFTANYGDDKVQLASQSELSKLIGEVEALARPTWLELVSPDEQLIMHIGLGRPAFSTITFYDWREGGGTFHSAGTLDAPDDTEFDYGGVPTTMSGAGGIAVEDAHTAAAEFLRTGERPKAIGWIEATA